MKIEGLDKQVEYIVNYMNDNGIKTYASCDGVFEEHEEQLRKIYQDDFDELYKNKPAIMIKGYISMMDNKYIVDLLANTYEQGFGIEMTSAKETFDVYGIEVSGKTFAIRFSNYEGENTDIINRIITETIEEKLKPKKETREFVEKYYNALSNDEKTRIHPSITFRDNGLFCLDNDPYDKDYVLMYLANHQADVKSEEVAKEIERKFKIQAHKFIKDEKDVQLEESYTLYFENRKDFRLILRNKTQEEIIDIIKYLNEY